LFLIDCLPNGAPRTASPRKNPETKSVGALGPRWIEDRCVRPNRFFNINENLRLYSTPERAAGLRVVEHGRQQCASGWTVTRSGDLGSTNWQSRRRGSIYGASGVRLGRPEDRLANNAFGRASGEMSNLALERFFPARQRGCGSSEPRVGDRLMSVANVMRDRRVSIWGGRTVQELIGHVETWGGTTLPPATGLMEGAANFLGRRLIRREKDVFGAAEQLEPVPQLCL